MKLLYKSILSFLLIFTFFLAAELTLIYISIIQQTPFGYFFLLFLGLLFFGSLCSPFFLFYFLYKKQKVDFIIIVGVLILISIPLSLFFSLKFQEYYPRPLPYGSDRLSYDKELWVNNEYDDYTNLYPRQEMLQEVVEKLPGKNKQQIIELLGKEPDSEYFSESKRDLIYKLGDERNFMSIDSGWLLIWFDNKGIFEKYEIRND